MLVNRLFESDEFVSWEKGNYRLHVFLDSLDECLVRSISMLLIRELKFRKCPVERLNLRISCRTNKWPISLENDLRELWGKDAVGVYELAPLRRLDVVEAAKEKNMDVKKFIHEIDRTEAIPLTVKPNALGFVFNIFANKGSLPAARTDLYLEGCRLLCEETNLRRRDMGLISAYTAEQFLAIAARIAAVTIFANQNSIWTGLDNGDVPPNVLQFEKLRGGYERVSKDKFKVNAVAVKETLCTSLFSSRGPNLTGWAYQTYSEFLAAWYLVQSQMTLEDIKNLLIHPYGIEKRLVPQLHGVAAWVASLRLDVFKFIINLDPEILLNSDLFIINPEDKANLVSTLLKQYDEGKLLDFDRDIRRMYGKLSHPRLAEQLKPYICGKDKNEVVRRIAISIAEACDLQSLQDDFADIALDIAQPRQIRLKTAHALCVIGNDKTRAKLKPLAIGECGEDPDDELKGYGLRALWPNNITAEELFRLLKNPKRPSWFGNYHYFISYELAKNLRQPDLSIALNWVKGQKRTRPGNCFDHLIDNIILEAWKNLDDSVIANNFAEVIVSKLRNENGFLSYERDSEIRTALINDDRKRRLLIETMLPLISNVDSISDLVYSNPPLVLNKDFYWAIEHVKSFECTEMKSRWARIIKYIFNMNDSNQIESILLARKASIELAEEFEANTRSIKLQSDEADKLRERYQRSLEYPVEKKEKHLLEPPPNKRIAKLLDDFESGDYAAWWRLNMELTLVPDSEL